MGYSLEQLKALGIVPAFDPVPDEQNDIPKVKKKQGRPEGKFQTTFIKMAKMFGWTVAHFHKAKLTDGRWITPVDADGKGFPDLLCIHEVRKEIFVAELKCKSSPSPEQKFWLRLFNLVGIPAYLWRPKHWDQIQEVLTGTPR